MSFPRETVEEKKDIPAMDDSMVGPGAIVLAAGKGLRLRPLTRNRPKLMLRAATKPILEHVFDQLVDAGVGELVVVVGYRRTRVQSHFDSSYRSVPVTYVVQKSQLGTGHALLAAEFAVDDCCLAVYGDQIIDSPIITDVLEAHGSSIAVTVGLMQRSTVREDGSVLTDDGTVTEMVENPRDNRNYLLNAGVYAFEQDAFDGVRDADPRTGEHSLVDGLSALLEHGATIYTAVSDGLWDDATYLWDLLDITFELFDAGIVDGPSRATGTGNGPIHASAVIREPIVVDRDCVTKPGAVGPYVSLGENVTVVSITVVERSAIDTDTRIGSNATVREYVTETCVTIGPGSVIPGGPGDVRVDGRVFEEERLGGLLADRVLDQGEVTYGPGTIVGPDATLRTGATVRGTIAGEAEVWS